MCNNLQNVNQNTYSLIHTKEKKKRGKRRMYVDMDLYGDRCQLDKHI